MAATGVYDDGSASDVDVSGRVSSSTVPAAHTTYRSVHTEENRDTLPPSMTGLSSCRSAGRTAPSRDGAKTSSGARSKASVLQSHSVNPQPSTWYACDPDTQTSA